MAKPNEVPQTPKHEQTIIPSTITPKAPVHFAIHCREDSNGDFIVVEVAYSTDAPAKERELFRHASSSMAIVEYGREVRVLTAALIHPSRFKTRAAVVQSAT